MIQISSHSLSSFSSFSSSREYGGKLKAHQWVFEDPKPIVRISELAAKNFEKKPMLENFSMLSLIEHPWLKYLKFSIETEDRKYLDAVLNRNVSEQPRKATFEIAFNQIVDANTFLSRIRERQVHRAFSALTSEGEVHVTSYLDSFGCLLDEGLTYIVIALKLIEEEKPELNQKIYHFAKNFMRIT